MIVTSCAFCGRKYLRIWDCQLVSFLHIYYYWCIVAHFYVSTKCLVKDWNQDIHPN
jgi:hypothetical protein